jgi:hypothetical protein
MMHSVLWSLIIAITTLYLTNWKPLNRTLQPFDLWWTHHPTWVIANETGDMFCVEPADETSAMMRNFTAFYQTQFESGCDRIHWRMMWSSGWGADLMNVQVSCAGIT